MGKVPASVEALEITPISPSNYLLIKGKPREITSKEGDVSSQHQRQITASRAREGKELGAADAAQLAWHAGEHGLLPSTT